MKPWGQGAGAQRRARCPRSQGRKGRCHAPKPSSLEHAGPHGEALRLAQPLGSSAPCQRRTAPAHLAAPVQGAEALVQRLDLLLVDCQQNGAGRARAGHASLVGGQAGRRAGQSSRQPSRQPSQDTPRPPLLPTHMRPWSRRSAPPHRTASGPGRLPAPSWAAVPSGVQRGGGGAPSAGGARGSGDQLPGASGARTGCH